MTWVLIILAVYPEYTDQHRIDGIPSFHLCQAHAFAMIDDVVTRRGFPKEVSITCKQVPQEAL